MRRDFPIAKVFNGRERFGVIRTYSRNMKVGFLKSRICPNKANIHIIHSHGKTSIAVSGHWHRAQGPPGFCFFAEECLEQQAIIFFFISRT